MSNNENGREFVIINAGPVTHLVKNLNPRIKEFLDRSVRDFDVKINQVHRSYSYESLVRTRNAYSFMGIFYNYLIRKELYNRLNIDAKDSRADDIEEESDEESEESDDESEESSEEERSEEESEEESDEDEEIFQKDRQEFLESYQVYKRKENRTLDITKDIFNTSMLHAIWFDREYIRHNPKYYNINNLKDVISYVQTVDLEDILINPAVGCEYFSADANTILKDTIFNFRVSKFIWLKGNCSFIEKDVFYQLIYYALGFWISTSKEIRKFKFYNPLLGYEYLLEVPTLDFNEFFEIMKREQTKFISSE